MVASVLEVQLFVVPAGMQACAQIYTFPVEESILI